MIYTLSLHVRGIVQGVGFRPFLHRLADTYGLNGWGRNTPDGLEAEFTGERTSLDSLVSQLSSAPPPMALIEEIQTDFTPVLKGREQTPDGRAQVGGNSPFPPAAASRGILPANSSDSRSAFSILKSRTGQAAARSFVSPDIAMCPDCKKELETPSDRRFRYPFINCTNCGPRYSIIHALPYDRIRTSMKAFSMCPDCLNEYQSLDDRRYHAQPDCCPACGPVIFYRDAAACREVQAICGEAAIQKAQETLARGGIVAVKGTGGIHLACDARQEAAVRRLRFGKHRPSKPLPLMCRSLEEARAVCRMTPEEEAILQSPAHPIVLLPKRDPGALPFISQGTRLGLMLPYTPLHHLLLDGSDGGPALLAMTSANRPGCPVLTENQEALSALSGIADGFLLHNRPIVNRCDDSLVMEWKGAPYFLRRSRGYAPAPISLARDASGVLAFGAEQKASFALGRERFAFPSPHIGDLKNEETRNHYRTARKLYQRLFSITPAVLVCDLHPDYGSVREAREMADRLGLPLLPVQHHADGWWADGRRANGRCANERWTGERCADGRQAGGQCADGQ